MSQITYKLITKHSDKVTNMVTALCDEIKYEFNCLDIEKSLKLLFANPTFTCAGAYDENELVGIIAFLTYPEIYNYNKLNSSEQFWYVYPSYRKGVGLELVKYIEKELYSDKITFGISNPSLQRLLQRNGYSFEKTLMSKVL